MADHQAWLELEEELREERESAYRESEQAATGFLRLSNETIHMIFYLTGGERMREVFVSPVSKWVMGGYDPDYFNFFFCVWINGRQL
jgi:hypothetical protein